MMSNRGRRDLGPSESAQVKGDEAATGAESGGLRVPHAAVSNPCVDEHERLTLSGDLVVKGCTIQIGVPGKLVGCHDGSYAFALVKHKPSYSVFAM
jgi:hypothetical protein